MTPARKKRLVAQAKALPALLQVGKNGISDAFVEELVTLLKKRELVKVRLLKSFTESLDAKAAANDLATRAKAELVGVTGNTVLLAKSLSSVKKQ